MGRNQKDKGKKRSEMQRVLKDLAQYGKKFRPRFSTTCSRPGTGHRQRMGAMDVTEVL